MEARIPTHLWVEAKIRELSAQGIGVYVLHKGERNDGQILLKLLRGQGECRLLTRQRNWDGDLEWVNAQKEEMIAENDADSVIKRSINRDPDLWVIEIGPFDIKGIFI